ncbi:asparagine synthase (glutamine-hydrolyzing) [uncultured Kiloniella sp.]|uniref:asparagine synthase (glutamine-hydrolyzing) n=1 Tax=uncultured Kiloniella sp. TaxID=1133091 RepID=UPI00261250DA|nr:asparagine synthase (glutamine-hydrolyzing) [uncultured Kiloniella sp.]
MFGSEMKAILEFDIPRELDHSSIYTYLQFNYIPEPHSIFKAIKKLEPGHYLKIDNTLKVQKIPFYQLNYPIQKEEYSKLSFLEAEKEFLKLIDQSVEDRLVSDVPLGTFLSGGIDSSLVTALASKKVNNLSTFSIGFSDDPQFDETEYALAVSKMYKTNHHVFSLSRNDLLDSLDETLNYLDEPFADSSQIPTFLVSQLARQKVTVSLSGDGGDELFTGYNRYFWGDLINRRRDVVPPFFRKLGTRSIRQLSTDRWDQLSRYLPGKARIPQLGLKAHKVADILAIEDEAALFRRLVTVWDNPNTMVSGAKELQNILWDKSLADDVAPFMERMQVLDGKTYLPDDILTKVDRASMAVSLEARVPLLDHRVAEFAFRLPRHMRVRNGQGKWALREILARYVPRELFERPKMGFGIPIGNWLKGELRDWCEELLSPEALEADGLLDAVPIRTVWERHLAGKQNHEVQLWTVLMYQSWRHKWLND